MEKSYEKIYDWNSLKELFETFLPELIDNQMDIRSKGIMEKLPSDKRVELENIGFSNVGRSPEDVARQVIDTVYPYAMKTNHPRNFCFIPNDASPYSVMGDVLNSMHNPYGGGFSVSEATAALEIETIKWMGSCAGYDVSKLGGQFVSGGSMANLTAMIVARDEKLKPEEFIKGIAYVSDQTHSSVAKASHVMGIPRKNVRIVPSNDKFQIDTKELKKALQEDLEKGLKPFLLVASAGVTNTGAIDPLEELSQIATEFDLWYHVDGAYGASVLISSHKDLLKGIEKSDSLSWDGHKWLFQTYGCAAIICRDKKKLVNTFSVNPEYLRDVESTETNYNFWDMGVELTKPARGMKLWFTLQTVGIDTMKDAIDQGFIIANWIEEEVKKYEDFEIISPSQMGIINFRYVNEKYSEEELDDINRMLSQKALKENYAAFMTTELKNKIVLRFCANHPMTTRDEISTIITDLRKSLKEMNV